MIVVEQLAYFSFFPILFSWLWYQVILGKGLQFMFQISDFGDANYSGVTVSPFFAFRFLWNYSLGASFVIAVVFALLLFIPFRKKLQETSRFDLVCSVTVLPIILIDIILGVTLNLKVPYTSAVKYDYQALPFLCLIAASLAGKSATLLKNFKLSSRISKSAVLLIVSVSVILLSLTISWDIYTAHHLATSNYIVYMVTADQTNVGYSLFNYTPASQYSVLLNFQYLGYAVLLLGLLVLGWRSIIRFFVTSFNPMRLWIEAKNARASKRRGNA